MRSCLKMSAIAVLSLTGMVLLIGRPMLGLFADDPVVIDTGYSIIRVIVPAYISYIFVEILSGAMRGTGESFIPTLMTLAGICVVRVFWVSVVLPMRHELSMLMIVYPITWTITGILFIIYYRRGKWLKRRIRVQEAAK